MTVLRPPSVDFDVFTNSGGVLVAEISDFGPGFAFGRVYDDAVDVGLTVVSSSLSREIVFAVNGEHTRDGDLTHWELVAVHPPELRGTLMTLFND